MFYDKLDFVLKFVQNCFLRMPSHISLLFLLDKCSSSAFAMALQLIPESISENNVAIDGQKTQRGKGKNFLRKWRLKKSENIC